MTAETTYVLGLTTALDTETARRLHDYGDINDAGVVAALEQAGQQGTGPTPWPGYLSRITHLALIAEHDDELTLAAFESVTLAEERGALQSLFALMQDARHGRNVAWHAADWQLLAQRAYHHALPAPDAVWHWPRLALQDMFQTSGERVQAVQSDVLHLYEIGRAHV